MAMNFRLATLEDIPQLIELRILMQTEVNGSNGAEAEYAEKLRGYFSRGLRDGGFVAAVAEAEGGKLVSANGLVVYRKPPSINGKTGSMGYVSNVYTRREFRNRGLATKLMETLIDYARENGVERLHLGATELGRGVYERVGFKVPKFVNLELRL